MIKELDDRYLLKKIQNSIDYRQVTDLGLASGLAGTILFQFSLSRFLDSDVEFLKGKNMIEFGIKEINNGNNWPTYSNGIAGFFWALQYLHENEIVIVEDDTFYQVDDFLFDTMTQSIKDRNYDLLHGAIGYGMYFVKRYNNSREISQKNKYKYYIKEIVDFLDVSKIEDSNGIKWKSYQESNIANKINIDLGLAHGIPSIICFLSLVYEAGLFRQKIKHLLDGSTSYLLSTKNKKGNLISLFPTHTYHFQVIEEYETRLAWCYGDLGVGLSLLKVANTTTDIKMRNEALDILKHSSLRRGVDENFLKDAGICHGAYGISQIFGRLYKKTSMTEFSLASNYWKNVGNKMAIFDENTNISYLIHLGDRDWTKPFSLLEGLSGIGLCLISHLTSFEDNWDECLLID